MVEPFSLVCKLNLVCWFCCEWSLGKKLVTLIERLGNVVLLNCKISNEFTISYNSGLKHRDEVSLVFPLFFKKIFFLKHISGGKELKNDDAFSNLCSLFNPMMICMFWQSRFLFSYVIHLRNLRYQVHSWRTN